MRASAVRRAVMVSVGFPVSRGSGSSAEGVTGSASKSSSVTSAELELACGDLFDSLHPAKGIGQHAAERNAVRHVPVVRIEGDLPSLWWCSAQDPREQQLTDLMQGQHRGLNALGGQDIERFVVDCSFGQPHAGGFAPKRRRRSAMPSAPR
ncbi:MAG: hypothetical protein U0163_13865 [Gemmatimonadaceae bacterium]